MGLALSPARAHDLTLSRALTTWLTAPVDIASLALFRALFGLVMAGSTLRYLLKGWVETQLLLPSFHFSYPGFSFVVPWSRPLMLAHLLLQLVSAVLVCIGFCTRGAALTFLCTFAYVELIDRAAYLNHYYLVTLLALLLTVFPAGKACSVDARMAPQRALTSIPRWILLTFRLQVAVVYLFAGLAKLQPDWLFAAQPLKLWLSARSDLPWLGAWLAWPITAHLASWLGAVFDLTIVPVLLWPRTRLLGVLAALSFHLLTGLLFPIGIFPWLMTAAMTLLLAPDWPRRLGLLPAVSSARSATLHVSCTWFALLCCLFNVLLPLTRHMMHRDAAWTGQGFDFSWRVMVAEKAGSVEYELIDRNTGAHQRVRARDYLVAWQERALIQDPALITQLAHEIARQVRAGEGRDVAVHAHAFASLNGRPAQRFVDERVDLSHSTVPPPALPLGR
jgi:vitamin K-dependent gamma-carboxylase